MKYVLNRMCIILQRHSTIFLTGLSYTYVITTYFSFLRKVTNIRYDKPVIQSDLKSLDKPINNTSINNQFKKSFMWAILSTVSELDYLD